MIHDTKGTGLNKFFNKNRPTQYYSIYLFYKNLILFIFIFYGIRKIDSCLYVIVALK